jgi:hypothetical protein
MFLVNENYICLQTYKLFESFKFLLSQKNILSKEYLLFRLKIFDEISIPQLNVLILTCAVKYFQKVQLTQKIQCDAKDHLAQGGAKTAFKYFLTFSVFSLRQ